MQEATETNAAHPANLIITGPTIKESTANIPTKISPV